MTTSAEPPEPGFIEVQHSHLDEDSLEPVTLIQQSGAIMRMGRMMLAAGTASYRVKEAMQSVARALGSTSHSEHVTLTEITATTHRGSIFRTEVSEVRMISVDASRIAALDRMRRTLPERTTPAQVHQALDAIEALKPRYPLWANAIFAGVACAGFAVLNRARLWEVLVVLVAASLGQALRRFMHRHHVNHFGTIVAAALVSSALYIGGLEGLGWAGVDMVNHAAGYISAVLYLLPGFALITGALDIAKLDLSAGISRIAFGTTMTMAAAAAVWVVSLAEPLDVTQRAVGGVPSGWDVVVWALASAAGVMGFALMFNAPWTMAAWAGGIGAVANTLRLVAIEEGLRSQAATAAACVLVGVLAAWVARGGRWPVITLSVPAVLVMIPGVTAHQAVVSVNEAQYAEAMAGILQAGLSVLAIMMGLVIAKLLTDRQWTLENNR